MYEVLELHAVLTMMTADVVRRRHREPAKTRRADARRMVDRTWGAAPDVAFRFEFRQLLHAQLLGAFFALGCAAAALIALGSATGLIAVLWAGRAVLVVACVPLGLHGPIAFRTIVAERDARMWVAAGQPASWQPRALSQPRAADLVAAGILLVAWAAFFLMLTRP